MVATCIGYDKAKNFYEKFLIWLYIFIWFGFAISYTFRYAFRKNGNYEILFFEEKRIECLSKNPGKCFKITYLCDENISFYSGKVHCFKYTKENFVNFEILNDILSLNSIASKIKNGMIECDYELIYFLKITKDIANISNTLTNNRFRNLLLTLKCLKAVENNNIIKLFHALIFIDIFSLNSYKKVQLDFKQIFDSCFANKIHFSIKNNLISAILNINMMKYVWYDGNLLFLENCKEKYDTSLFDEHIPYKNLLVNSYKVFCTLENILKNSYTFNSLKILLKIINIKAFIINNYLDLNSIPDIEHKFLILSMNIFESIIISYIDDFSSLFLYRLNGALKKDIEFLRFKNLSISKNNLDRFLRQRKLRGFLLGDVDYIDFFPYIELCMHLNDTLEYIFFRNVSIDINWWMDFLLRAKIHTIILSFDNSSLQESFIKAFIIQMCFKNVLYFDCTFCNLILTIDFCNSLSCWRNLKNLKLKGYETNEKTEIYLLKAIEGMKNLVYLTIGSYKIPPRFYNISLQKQKIKVLQLKNYSSRKKPLLVDLYSHFNKLTKLVLTKITISFSTMNEIFRLENLTSLSLKLCIVEPIGNLNHCIRSSRNLYMLNFYATDLKVISHLNIFETLELIEYLNLSCCNLPMGYLAKICTVSSSKLKKLSYGLGILDSNDLDAIKYFETLEELNLFGCVFHGTSFHKLDSMCKFFKSLRKLDLWLVKICMKDLKYLINFKYLKRMRLTPTGLDLLAVKNYLVLIPICRFEIDCISQEKTYDEFLKCLYEDPIYVELT
ncbi:hypothetical protein LUQ84_003388 [Hamiltosporidium tvaerminnensis]|nr:hypothetical protein LUQ84_003388 [Hamiltosporidium tvaerminnensis]